jgi:CheY-like chemotaxis protein
MIVMDINMPSMDGVVATNKIRAFLNPYVKKIG